VKVWLDGQSDVSKQQRSECSVCGTVSFDSTKMGTRITVGAHPGQGTRFSFRNHFARRAADDVGGLLLFAIPHGARVYVAFIVPLKAPFKLGWSDAREPTVKALGRFARTDWGRARKGAARTRIRRRGMFWGHIDTDGAVPVEASAISDVLFERGLYWSSGRSGVINLVAAHKWFNLAALKGRRDAIALRREVAELMSDAEIATAQREARAWMTAH
jgi:uncharacterized protein